MLRPEARGEHACRGSASSTAPPESPSLRAVGTRRRGSAGRGQHREYELRARSSRPLPVSLSGAVATALPLVLVTACTPASTPAVRAAADGFQSAVRTGDAATACRLLSSDAREQLELTAGEPCEQVLPGLGLHTDPPRDPAVWGDQAQVRLPGGGALFLARFSEGWRVTAAGCRPRGGGPYSCPVRG